MNKINFLFSILLILFPESILYGQSFSNLLDYVRLDLVNRALVFLPQRIDTDLLQLCDRMSGQNEKYAFNKAEIAYFIFVWIQRNIRLTYSNNTKYNQTPDIIFKIGKGRHNDIALLFKEMYNQFGIEAGIISGYAKFSKRIENDREWNYIKLNNTYYLIDVSYKDWFRNKEEIYIYYDYLYVYFGTKPEIFIRSHFPKETKWQLLNEANSISFKQFLSMVYLKEGFYIDGFKTISPDSYLISKKPFNFKFNL